MPGILRRVVIGRVNDPLDSTAPKVLTQCPSRYGHSADNGGPPETRTQLRFLAKDSRGTHARSPLYTNRCSPETGRAPSRIVRA